MPDRTAQLSNQKVYPWMKMSGKCLIGYIWDMSQFVHKFIRYFLYPFRFCFKKTNFGFLLFIKYKKGTQILGFQIINNFVSPIFFITVFMAFIDIRFLW